MDKGIVAANEQSDGRRNVGARIWGLPAFVIISVGIAGAAALFYFDPSRHSFYPPCYFYRVTGYYCPGCGSLRALHQLLHGKIGAAFHFNALTVSALPIVGWLAARRIATGRGAGVGRIKSVWLWGALALIVIFGIARNLSFPVCLWLAPPHS